MKKYQSKVFYALDFLMKEFSFCYASVSSSWKNIIRKKEGKADATLVVSHFNDIRAYLKDRHDNPSKYQTKSKVVLCQEDQANAYMTQMMNDIREAYPDKSEHEISLIAKEALDNVHKQTQAAHTPKNSQETEDEDIDEEEAQRAMIDDQTIIHQKPKIDQVQ
jgi:hypothetical protein